MKFPPITAALAWILVSLTACAQATFAQGKGAATQRTVAPPLRNALSANEWALVNIFNIHGVEEVDWPRSSGYRDPSVTLTFDRSGYITGQVCNIVSWRYSLSGGDRIKISPDFTTYAACDATTMRLEARVTEQVSSATRALVDAYDEGAPRLTLRTSDGSRLVFKGRPAKAN